MVNMQPNVSLKDYTTMRLGGPAKALATATTPEEIVSFASQAEAQHIPILVIGAGSNIIVNDDGFDGLIVLNRIPGFEVLDDKDPHSTTIKVGAGLEWDELVQKTVDMNLSGIENLSSIPGFVGAAPIQNIGAYGQEIANALLELEAYDLKQKKFVTMTNADCGFAYRRSIFNTGAKHRYVITSVTLRLSEQPLQPPFYDSLARYLESHAITDYSPKSLRACVKAIRAIRLPDPLTLANSGSFFKNPIIKQHRADELLQQYPSAPLFAMDNKLFKVSAGWMIEQAGLKDLKMHGMRVYDKNALVLVNEHATSYQRLQEIRQHIINAVYNMFQIRLEQEPEEIST